MRKLYGGIDIGLKEYNFPFHGRDGKALGKAKRFPNNVLGILSSLITWIYNATRTNDVTSVSLLGMEATGLYWFPLFHALQNVERIQQRDTRFLAMNPKLVESFRHTNADVDKTDKVDASIIADRVRFVRGVAPQHIQSEQFSWLYSDLPDFT